MFIGNALAKVFVAVVGFMVVCYIIGGFVQ